jgi:hypothetical protein
VAFYCVCFSLLLAGVSFLLFSFQATNPDAAGLVLSLSAGCLTLAPFAFVLFLPNSGLPPVQVAWGGWLGGMLGLLALCVTVFSINSGGARWLDKTSPAPLFPVVVDTQRQPSPVASYGAL